MKNPIPLKYRLFRRYKGCLKQPDDSRDIVLGDIPFTPDPNAPTFEEGFDNEEKYGVLKREHQGGSLSCCGQGWSKYLEMINKIEETWVDLSARDIYSQIYLDNGGSYIRLGALIAVNKGNCEEDLMNSYLADGSPPNEALMRTREEGTEDNALIYKSKRFVHLDTSHPLTNEDWENIRQVIYQYGGFVSGYKRHCMFASGYGVKNGKRFIHFINSYGENNDRYLYEGDNKTLYDITFLVDLPNPPDKIKMKKIILHKPTNKQYLVGDDKKLRHIYNEYILNELHNSGVVNKNEVEEVDTLQGFEVVNPWASLAQ